MLASVPPFRGIRASINPGALHRLVIEPDISNQLREASRLMVDKITTVPRSKLGERIGQLTDEDMIRVGRATLVLLGLAGT